MRQIGKTLYILEEEEELTPEQVEELRKNSIAGALENDLHESADISITPILNHYYIRHLCHVEKIDEVSEGYDFGIGIQFDEDGSCLLIEVHEDETGGIDMQTCIGYQNQTDPQKLN